MNLVSEEIASIKAINRHLSILSGLAEHRAAGPIADDRTADLKEVARGLLRSEQGRTEILSPALPHCAWMILIDLFANEGQQHVSVSSACIASLSPPTTALRWIQTLEERGLIGRSCDNMDGRRTLLFLTDHGRQAAVRYLIS